MEVTAFSIPLLTPPKDDLLSKIKASALALQEGDCVALASKVIAIHQGRCVPRNQNKEELVKREAEYYLDEPSIAGVIHTIKDGILIGNAGIDPLGDFYILWPERPRETAEELLGWFKKEYNVQDLKLVIVDSRSVMMRQGAVGIALAWAGFNPLYDNRNRTDLLGAKTGGTQSNLVDGLAAAAALAMGEANELTPLSVIRGVPYMDNPKPSPDVFEVSIQKDLYAPFLKNQNWRKGGSSPSA